MSLQAGRTQLLTASKELLRHWDHTKELWSDKRSEAFEADFLYLLQSTVSSAAQAADELANLIATARRECE